MLVCRDRLAAYQKQQLSYIVSRISGNNLLKKILSCLWHSYALETEVKYLHNRVYIAYNRKGLTTFAVFLCRFLSEHRTSLLLAWAAVRRLSI